MMEYGLTLEEITRNNQNRPLSYLGQPNLNGLIGQQPLTTTGLNPYLSTIAYGTTIGYGPTGAYSIFQDQLQAQAALQAQKLAMDRERYLALARTMKGEITPIDSLKDRFNNLDWE
jgi:hypothetical protein